MVLDKFNELRIERVCSGLKKRGINPYYCTNVDELIETVSRLLEGCKTAANGGSMTLKESGIIDLLRTKEGLDYLDLAKCKTDEEKTRLMHEAFNTDVYFMSTNAISEDGTMVNIDGRANRLACLLYGPKKVVIVVGVNKIVSTVDEAMLRARSVAAPMNSMRLERNTPCCVDGMCHDCQSPDSICSQFVLTRHSSDPDRIHVVIVNQEYGF